MMIRPSSAFSAMALALLFALPLSAQATRTILNRADLPGAPGMEVISSILEVQPGETVPRHFHNGIESGYTLEGSLIQLPGKEPQMLATGASIWNLPGVFHGGFKVVGTTPLKLYTVHIVDKNKPLFDGTEPAK
ncbi:cupin domain-containing protein [Massilia sp. B-10]|nr:cupin domain-containing protein [Massilia sp. B-10]